VVGAVGAMQAGQALAKWGFALAGPLPIAALRFGIGALVLCVICRPGLPGDRRTLAVVAALGSALAGVNVLIYEAVERMPLGLAVTIQFTGALAVSLGGARRVRDGLWALLAAGGVIVITGGFGGAVSLSGVLFSVGSATCWGAYIVLSARVGAATRGGSGLALASVWAAVITVPLGVAAHPQAFLRPPVLASGFGVALLCTVAANWWELAALRRLRARVFGVLASLEPAVAALLGLVVLGEQLTGRQWLALVAIVAASIAVTLDHPAAPRSLEVKHRLCGRTRGPSAHVVPEKRGWGVRRP
jgi:inner membrane transporter RhtA